MAEKPAKTKTPSAPTEEKRKKLRKSRSSEAIRLPSESPGGTKPAAPGSGKKPSAASTRIKDFKFQWSELQLIEHQSIDEFTSIAVTPNHVAFWNLALASLAHFKDGGQHQVRRWKTHLDQVHFWTYHTSTLSTSFASANAVATISQAKTGLGGSSREALPKSLSTSAFSRFIGAAVVSVNVLVLFSSAEENDSGSIAKFAALVKSEIEKRKIVFHSQVEIHGNQDLVNAFLQLASKRPTDKPGGATPVSPSAARTIYLGATTQVFHRTVYNSVRLFHIMPSDMASKKSKAIDAKDQETWKHGILRNAKAEDLEVVKDIYMKSNGDEDDANKDDNSDDSDESGDTGSKEVRKLTENIQKGRIYLWEVDLDPTAKVGVGPRSSGKQPVCFALLEYHDRKVVDDSCVELIDIHMANPEVNQPHARVLVRSLAQHYLVKSDKRQPYQFLFVQVDTDIPESSDKFLLECGFRLDSTVVHATINAITPSARTEKAAATSTEKKAFSIANHVTVASSTEAPFTAFMVENVATGTSTPKRYREFYKLHDRIRSVLPKATVPKPPKKKLFGNMDEDFIEKRKKKLEAWLNLAASIPGVKENGILDEFLTVEMKRRGVRELTEEERLIAVLKRANETPVQIIQRANQPPPALSVDPGQPSLDGDYVVAARPQSVASLTLPPNFIPSSGQQASPRVATSVASPRPDNTSPRRESPRKDSKSKPKDKDKDKK